MPCDSTALSCRGNASTSRRQVLVPPSTSTLIAARHRYSGPRRADRRRPARPAGRLGAVTLKFRVLDRRRLRRDLAAVFGHDSPAASSRCSNRATLVHGRDWVIIRCAAWPARWQPNWTVLLVTRVIEVLLAFAVGARHLADVGFCAPAATATASAYRARREQTTAASASIAISCSDDRACQWQATARSDNGGDVSVSLATGSADWDMANCVHVGRWPTDCADPDVARPVGGLGTPSHILPSRSIALGWFTTLLRSISLDCRSVRRRRQRG